MEIQPIDLLVKRELIKRIIEFYSTLDPSLKPDFYTWAKRFSNCHDYRSMYSVTNRYRRYWTIHVSEEAIEPIMMISRAAQNLYRFIE